MQTTTYLEGIRQRASTRLSRVTEPDMDAWEDLWENLDYYRVYDAKISVTIRAPLKDLGYGSIGLLGRTKTHTGHLGCSVEASKRHYAVMSGAMVEEPQLKFFLDGIGPGDFFTVEEGYGHEPSLKLGGRFSHYPRRQIVDFEVSTDV